MSEDTRGDADQSPSLPEGFHRSVLDHVQAGIIVHSANSEIVYVNGPAADIFGCSKEDLLGSASPDFTSRLFDSSGESLPITAYPVSLVLRTGRAVKSLVVSIRRPNDGSVVWVQCNAYPMVDLGIDSRSVVVCFTDVTELKLSERALHDSEERLGLVLQGTRDASWDINLATLKTYLSPKWFELLGLSPEIAPDDFGPITDYVYPPDRDRVSLYSRNALYGKVSEFEIEFRLTHASGKPIPVLARAIISRDENGVAVRLSGSVRDLTGRNQNQDRIRQLALFDPVTSLPNRWLFSDRVNMAQNASAESGHIGAVFLIDLDHFKIVNETFSHPVGDQLLQLIGARLQKLIGHADTLARLGGDEFAILIQDLAIDAATAQSEAASFAQSLLAHLAEPFHFDEVSYRTTASIGISLINGRDLIQDDLGRHLDLAMYEAKENGRNTWRFFEDRMLATLQARIALDRDLSRSLVENQLLLYFQAQVNAAGAVTGAEVLLRWNHPVRGLVPPNDFIEAAERSGAIVQIGYWVFEQACLQLAQWAQDPDRQHLYLSINVSVRQFQEDDFGEQVIDILRRSGAPPHQLKLEITETLLVEDIAHVSAKMKQISLTGISFSLDDFGVGYSSLFHLQRLPLQEVKIDRMFVRELRSNASGNFFARLIISLGHQLGVRVVAEGVETDEQRQVLLDDGCHYFQGFLFHRPAPIMDFQDFCQPRASGSRASTR